ncbi:hypothetical protein VFPPC_13607 [Pochonia chlamydosporia 170]|uniref:Uncharacterized protein n=1 Tax=Pochonia chlamydosporia 170 TaxID=1380566 RepID=A0A179FSC7_METCM|nr:hypothetical protein VFPPC_13607 [Pochonia chlamydosporia 170]OAQ68041.1 hypothetical protein VFPPC_13607 [Pochonia chlamydosporia 170]
METPEKCKKLVDALAEGGRGFPTLEVTETFVWPDEFDANEVANDGKKEVELLTSKAEAVSIKLASVLYPDRGYVDRNETLANHLHEDISRIRQIIDIILLHTFGVEA